MKVKELIEELSKIDPELDVVLQIDPEGNGYREVNGVDDLGLVEMNENLWFVHAVYSSDWSAVDSCMEEDEWDDFKKTARRLAIIFP